MVVFPEPVGPVTRMIPSLYPSSRSTCLRSSTKSPSVSRESTVDFWFRIRITTFSP